MYKVGSSDHEMVQQENSGIKLKIVKERLTKKIKVEDTE